MLLLVYSLTLLAAVLLSERFNRTVLSAAVLFLTVGFVCGPRGVGLLAFEADDCIVSQVSNWALVAILFTDALRVGWLDLRRGWRLPGRALFLGLPLTIIGVALVARLLINVAWKEAFLVGAILSPTDPVFASAIVGRKEIPGRLRHLLNIESGLNDGLALPVVVVLMGMSSGAHTDVGAVVRETLGGVALGAVIGAATGRLRALRWFGVAEPVAPLHGLSALLLTYAACRVLHVNPYLGAFSAGVAMASICPAAADEFRALGEQISELLKLAAVLVFAVMFSGHSRQLPWIDYVFAALVLTFVRFIAIEVALLRSGLTRPERLTAAWFGPKGFASVVYGLMVLQSSVPGRPIVFELVALVIAMSIVLHSSTDVPVAKYFGRTAQASA